MTIRPSHWIAALTLALGGLVLTAGLLVASAPLQKKGALLVYDFDLGPVPARNVERVKRLGFDGLVTRCSYASDIPKLAGYARHVGPFDGFQMLAYVNYNFNNPDSPRVWRAVLPILATLDAPLWVIVQNAPTMAEVDNLLLLMAQTSATYGVPMVIYPHWNTDIEDVAEAATRIAQIRHPNMFNSIHTCHEIRSGNQYAMNTVLADHLANTRLVTIAGSESNAYAGPPPYTWDDAIMPLDRGGYDLTPILRALKRANYDGPVILHTWGLANEPKHLVRSIERYAEYLGNL